MITIRIEGAELHQGTTMVGQHLQLLMKEAGYEVEFVSKEHSPRSLDKRMAYLQSSPHLRQSLVKLPIRIVDHHTAKEPVHDTRA